MKTNGILNSVSRTFNRAGLQLQKHSPEILLVVGIAGVVATVVTACKATTKIDSVIDEAKERIDVIHEGIEDGEVISNVDGERVVVEYSEEDGKKDLAIVYAKTGLKLVKLYGPTVLLGSVSIACILASNNIIRKRNIALTSAYAIVDTSFKDYRSRVVERFGEELDRELKYDIKTKEIESIVIDDGGEERVETELVQVATVKEYSDFARIFDESCKGWTKDAELNLYFVKQVQRFCNERLQAKGHLFLNEVYEELGFPKTAVGQLYGWIYDEAHPVGDNYVDFGIYDIHDEAKRLFVNGRERSIILDFNVDGNIIDLI